MKKVVYLDHAAATPMDSRVRDAMAPYLATEYGNPGAIYRQGRVAKDALDAARNTCATFLHARMEEIVCTGSGTESDNLAIFGIARAYASKGQRIITNTIEHHAVTRPFEYLAKKHAFDEVFLNPDPLGSITPEMVAAALTPDTILVSIMYANNEIGTINNIRGIAEVIRAYKKQLGRGPLEAPFFHTDACQAAPYLDLDVAALGVDLLTLNGSKVYGPKGTGLLYVRRGIRLEPQILGGGQESRMRSGTENVAGIVGLAKALDIAATDRAVEAARLVPLRDMLISGIMERISKVVLNGHPTDRLPNNVNVSILDIEGEAMLLYLDEHGIAASTGSACDSISLDPSHVILGIGKPYEYAHASMRFTLGRSTTREDIAYVVDVLPPIVEQLRKISPVKIDLGGAKTIGSQADEKTATAFVGGRPHWEKSVQNEK